MNSTLVTRCNFLIIICSFVLVEGWKNGVKCIARYPPGREECIYNDCNFTNPSNVFYLGCENDCRRQHNSLQAYCGRDGYCYCEDPFMRQINNIGLMCQNISMAEEYQTICMEDCQCNHNTVGGGCNFYLKACECGEINRGEYICPYKTANEYFIDLASRYKRLGYPDILNPHMPFVDPPQQKIE